MVTAKSAHYLVAAILSRIRSAGRGVDASGIGPPLEVDLHAEKGPITIARPGWAVAIFWGGFANHQSLAGAVGEFLQFDATFVVGSSPEQAEAISAEVAVHLRNVRKKSGRLSRG